MKKFLMIPVFLSIGNLAQAQDATPGSFWSDPVNDPMFLYYVLIAFTFLVALVTLFAAIYIAKILRIMVQQLDKEKAVKEGREYVKEQSYLVRLWEKINKFRPMEEEKDIMLDHNYDGIRELDNYLPPWWKWLFYGTIIWGFGYLIAYHVTDSFPLSIEEYEIQVAAAEKARAQFLATQPPAAIDESALEYTEDPALIEAGKNIFLMNCASCHKNDGGGSIGPNLTDDYWIHGGSIRNIFATIKNGVPEKGMISWEPVLKPQEMVEVSYFIMSIHGTNPPAAKAPQGDLYTPEEIQMEEVPADTISN